MVEQDPISLQQAVIAGTYLLEEHGDQLDHWKAKELRTARRQIPPHCVGAIEFADRLSGSVPFPVAQALELVYAVDTRKMPYFFNLNRGMGYYQLYRFTEHGEIALVEAGRRKTLKDLLALRLQGLNLNSKPPIS